MINPTTALADIMHKHGTRGIFFADTTCLLRLKEMKGKFTECGKDFDKISRQLAELSSKGHYIFPHIHPHWKDAEYDAATNNWSLTNTRHYRLHSLNPEEQRSLVADSIGILNEVTGQPVEKIDSFRAGGWCIQPFADLAPIFSDLGIRYDFSVQRGFYQFTDAQHFDFTEHPEKYIYSFSSDVCREDIDGEFTEFSINPIRITSLNRIMGDAYLKFYYRITGDHTFHKGEGHVPTDDVSKIPASDNGFHMGYENNTQRISIELMHPCNLGDYKKFLKENDYMHFISHPKMINRMNMKCFDRFLKYGNSKYELESDFRKMIA
jgi:hypothetical protein